MRILHVIASADRAGGGPIEGILQQNASLGPREGLREIVSLDPPDAPFLKDYPVVVHATGSRRHDPRRPSRMRRFGYTPHYVPWLRAHASGYDCVIVNGLWNYASVGAARVLPELKTPYFVLPHGMMDPWFRHTYPLKHLQKRVSWRLFEARLMRQARRVFFTAQEEMQRAKDGGFPGAYRPMVIGYGAADAPRDEGGDAARFREHQPGLGSKPYLLFLGRIHLKKGCDLLIEAFAAVAAAHPDLHLVMAGPDQMGWVAELKARAAALSLGDRIHWPGMLTGASKWGAFRGAEAFILPSHQENFGIVVAEAMACALPVLTTDKVNIWREVVEAGAGLADLDDQAGVTRLLTDYLALPSAAKAEMRRDARRCFERNFHAAAAAQRLNAVLAEEIAAHRAA